MPVPTVTLGLEEEVFVLEHGRELPTLQSLDYLRGLLWRNPKQYMTHSASNFAKRPDRKECYMGSIEVATGVHRDTGKLVADLLSRRSELAKATRGAMVLPVGALFTINSPSNTASTHIHVGVEKSRRTLVYDNLAYFLPVLGVASASSPFAGGAFFGSSWRMAQEGLLGSLREDREYRFQDIILSKRLGTLEIRLFDPIPELGRLNTILRTVQAIAGHEQGLPFCRNEYNQQRESWTKEGMNSFVEERLSALQEIVEFPSSLLEYTFSDHLARFAQRSVLEAYAEADRIWRSPTGVERRREEFSSAKAVRGILGYYALRLPYMAWKGYKEWYGKT